MPLIPSNFPREYDAPTPEASVYVAKSCSNEEIISSDLRNSSPFQAEILKP